MSGNKRPDRGFLLFITFKVTRLGTLAPSQNRGPAQYLPTSKVIFMNSYSLDIISKVTVCFLDH